MKNTWKKNIGLFLAAQTVSLFGSSLVQYAIIWHITIATSSGVMLTLATLCGFVPQMLISLWAGAWIDRYNRRTLIMLSDGIIALVTLGIAVLFMKGFQNINWLFFALAVRSAGTGVQIPAVNAFLPQIIPQKYLMKINGINTTLNSLTLFLSPAASAAILSVMPITAVFFIDVVTAMIGIGIMFAVGYRPYQKLVSKNKNIWREIKAGVKYLQRNQMLMQQMIFMAVVLILVSPIAFLTPLLINRSFGPELWRLMGGEMIFSLGAAAGGALIAVWGGFPSRVRTILAATAAYGILMILVGVTPWFWGYLLFNFMLGVTMPGFNAPMNVLFQEQADAGMQGRVFSLMQIVITASLPLGTVFFGPLADVFRVEDILIFCGLVIIVVALWAWRSPNYKKDLSVAESQNGQ